MDPREILAALVSDMAALTKDALDGYNAGKVPLADAQAVRALYGEWQAFVGSSPLATVNPVSLASAVTKFANFRRRVDTWRLKIPKGPFLQAAVPPILHGPKYDGGPSLDPDEQQRALTVTKLDDLPTTTARFAWPSWVTPTNVMVGVGVAGALGLLGYFLLRKKSA